MAILPRALLVALLILQVAANLAIDVTALWLVEGQRWQRFDQLPIGLILGQLMAVALWFGVGDGRWYVRLLVSVALTLCLGKCLGIASWLLGELQNNEPDYSMLLAFIFLGMMLTASCAAFILRRTWGWRLTWFRVTSPSVRAQFQIGDVLLWMVIISGALAAMRFVFLLDESMWGQLAEILAYTLMPMSIVAAAAILAFSERRHWRKALLLLAVVVVTGAAAATPEAYRRSRLQNAFVAPSSPARAYVLAWFEHSYRYFICATAVAIAAAANFFVFRLLGCRLEWPESPPVTAISVENGPASALCPAKHSSC